MNQFRVHLFGKFRCERDGCKLSGLESPKIQQLFSYLLLYRTRSHNRELLIDALWQNSNGSQARKGLRQALWQLNRTVACADNADGMQLVQVDGEWVQINPLIDLWLDVMAIEAAYTAAERTRGRDLAASQVEQLGAAVETYQGELLEGCYQDWCIYERERLQFMYLAILDKLVGYCETSGDHATGINYGMRILRYDQARETTHRRLMRLYYSAGHRTLALAQFESCVGALSRELDVDPSHSTRSLYEQIREDCVEHLSPSPNSRDSPTTLSVQPDPRAMLTQLRQIEEELDRLQTQVARLIQTLSQPADRHRT